MLVANPEWICSRLVTRAASQPLLETVTRSGQADAIDPTPGRRGHDHAIVDELESRR